MLCPSPRAHWQLTLCPWHLMVGCFQLLMSAWTKENTKSCSTPPWPDDVLSRISLTLWTPWDSLDTLQLPPIPYPITALIFKIMTIVSTQPYPTCSNEVPYELSSEVPKCYIWKKPNLMHNTVWEGGVGAEIKRKHSTFSKAPKTKIL